MSTILKALKRLEAEAQDAPTADGGPPSWLTEAEASPKGIDRIWEVVLLRGRRFFTAILSLTVVAIAAGWIWMTLETSRNQEKPPSATPAPASRLAVNPEHARNFAAITQRPKATRPKPAPAPPPASALNAPDPVVAQETPAPPREDAAAPHPAQPAADRIQSAVTAGGDAVFSLLPVDAELSLQAISWSESVEKRIAVINDRVVHPGELVGDFAIEEIEPDAVILSRSGQTYRIFFRQEN